MCGFLGFASKEHIDDSFLTGFNSALETLRHRGPDGTGCYHDQNVYLGHQRLSIIDLSNAASQPFSSPSGQAIIVFNGEIYNYKELSDGLTLRTKSDTEVLLEGYLKYGIDFFERLRGIYAFAIFLKEQNKLILYRDLAGVKPLYFNHNPAAGTLVFGSELKAILPLIPTVDFDEDVLKAYIHLGYCVEPRTIYKNVYALAPGMTLTFDLLTGQVETNSRFGFDFRNTNQSSFSVNLNETKELLRQACKRNLVADVDVNIALSSGIDSSLVLALSRESGEVKSLTVKFDEIDYDETGVASIYAQHLGVKHTVVSTNATGKLELLDKLLLHFDQPYADSSLVPFYFLNKESSAYSKVLIGGDSGDEIQNGYIGFRILPGLIRLSQFRLMPFFRTLCKIGLALLPGAGRKRALRKFLNLISLSDRRRLLFEWNCWFPTLANSYPASPFKYDTSKVFEVFCASSGGSDEQSITETYFRNRMQSDYLRKSDMMSMYNGVEFRVPMLDEDLVRYSLSIPFRQKSDLWTQKRILRKIHAGIFPAYTSRLKKKGFSIPLDTWLGGNNLQFIKQYLVRKDGLVTKYITEDYIDVLFTILDTGDSESRKQQEYCSRASAYQRVLILYALQLWYFDKFLKIQRSK